MVSFAPVGAVPSAREYLATHRATIEEAFADAMERIVRERAASPLVAIAHHLLQVAGEQDPRASVSTRGRSRGVSDSVIDLNVFQMIDDSMERMLKPSRSKSSNASSSNDPGEAMFKVFEQFAGLDGDAESISYDEWLKTCHGRLQVDLGDAELERVWRKLCSERSSTEEVPAEELTLNYEQFVAGAEKLPFLQGIISQMRAATASNFDVPDDYDWDSDTSSNYRLPEEETLGAADEDLFFGEFRDIRATRDHAYHGIYSQARQRWQDGVIKASAKRTRPQPNPWVVYTCGAMGVGKGHALAWMSRHGFFPLENIVHIDPDHFKNVMPEWEGYCARAKQAGSLCHLESGYLQEVAQEVAMRNSQNVWVDGSLRNGQWAARTFAEIRRVHPQYRIAIFVVTAPQEVVMARVAKRAAETGRDVPAELVKQSMAAVALSLDILTPLCNLVARISNDAQPQLLALERVDSSANWDLIKSEFAQTHQEAGHFPDSLAPLILDGTAEQRKFLEALGERELLVSPAHPVNLREQARADAGIPPSAHSFAFVYPSKTPDLPQLARELGLNERAVGKLPLVKLLLVGGFVYFDESGDVCHVLSITQVGYTLNNRERVHLLQFGPKQPLPAEAAVALGARLRPITHPALLEKGARYFGWVMPCERLGGGSSREVVARQGSAAAPASPRQDATPRWVGEWKPPAYGGFCYLFREPSEPPSPHDCLFPIIST